MSLTGNLEHLPIVDVIQLLHSARKSGILQVRGRKGESQLVFKDGYIVSASHLNNSVRIGDVLVARKVLTQETLDQAIADQNQNGKERKPLIVTLVEKGIVQEKDAYDSLQSLIEMTILEILTWKKGTFVLEASQEIAADNYKFYPESLTREINVDTQSILMDALRVFDEKRRDGQLAEEPEEEFEDSSVITAEDLGLADLDQLERKIPGVFTCLDDRAQAGSFEAEKEMGRLVRRLNQAIAALSELKSVPEVALAVLQYVAEIFERTLTLIVGKAELIAEKGIGVKAAKRGDVTPPMGFRIPLAQPSLLREAVESGHLYFGACDDAVVKNHLFAQIGTPSEAAILLLPVKSFGKTVFLIVADFGDQAETPVPVELLEILAGQASLALENLLYRKKLESPSP